MPTAPALNTPTNTGRDQFEQKRTEADAEMRRIERDCGDLQDALDVLVSDFAMKYPDADTSELLRVFGKGLADVMDDLQGPAFRRKCKAECEIDDIEVAEFDARWDARAVS